MKHRDPIEQHSRRRNAAAFGILAFACLLAGCGRSGPNGSNQSANVIQSKGSDTMVNVAQTWAETYKRVAPDVEVEVSGGGSGVGLAALTRGTVDIANASRNIKPQEIEEAKRNTGKEPVEFVVGYDALAVYVHKDNPLDAISIDQLAQIYSEGGTMTRWSELGVTIPGVSDDEIVRISRQSSSGTYEFFREHVLSRHDFKLGSRDMNGSKEVVELVALTPTAIGYSGMGYNEPDRVKMLRIVAKDGDPGVAPTMESALNHTYPIARSLLIYTLGTPEGAIKKYVDWCMSDAGQAVVEECGYVPLQPDMRTVVP